MGGYWSNKVWHHVVRQKLGEDLVYYRAQLKHFSPEEISASISAMLAKERMESVRAFIIFGPNDILFRVWIHPNIAKLFRYNLAAALGSGTPEQFTVRRIVRKSYADDLDSHPNESALSDFLLDASTVRAVQTGEDEPLLKQLRASGLVKFRSENSQETIRFFIAVHVAKPEDPVLQFVAQAIDAELRARQIVKMPAVYMGEGFCEVLIKGEVVPDYYFTVGQLTRWISKHFYQHQVFTETYLVDSPDQLLGHDDVIADRTFMELRGRDLLVESIIPEVFTTLSTRSDSILYFLAEQAKGVLLKMEERRLLHDYLVGYLFEKPELSSASLILYLAALEATLRHNLDPFLLRFNITRPKLHEEANVPMRDGGKHASLGDLLTLSTKAISMAGVDNSVHFQRRWHELANLRNQPAHGEFDTSRWREHVKLLLESFPPIRELTKSLMESRP